MSVRDINKTINLVDNLTNMQFDSLDSGFFDVTMHGIDVSIGDFILLNNIHKCIDNNHNCSIRIGYKN